MDSRRALARTLLVLALALPAALSALLPPDSCTAAKCAALPKKFPNPSANFSKPATWSAASLAGVAYFRGILNQHFYPNSVPPPSDTYESWLALRNTPFLVNIERFPLDDQWYNPWAVKTTSLQSCCDNCRTSAECAEYLWRPSSKSAVAGALLTSGTCYILYEGTLQAFGPYKGVGPFNQTTHAPVGSPDPGSADYQKANPNKIPLGYLGSCE